MLVTFRTKAYANITMFGDVAKTLLKLMGHSGEVPSAIRAEDVPAALERLERSIEAYRQPPGAGAGERDEEEGGERPVSLATRALPLIELLKAAAARNADVTWS